MFTQTTTTQGSSVLDETKTLICRTAQRVLARTQLSAASLARGVGVSANRMQKMLDPRETGANLSLAVLLCSPDIFFSEMMREVCARRGYTVVKNPTPGAIDPADLPRFSRETSEVIAAGFDMFMDGKSTHDQLVTLNRELRDVLVVATAMHLKTQAEIDSRQAGLFK